MPSPHALAAERIRHWVLSAFPRGQSGIDYDHPIGDPGLFGPDSVTWRVHSDFPGMLAGGLCALMLQTLHPLALAGVWDHSNFRTDLVGRLRRTTNFVAGTTYASRPEAQKLIDRVAGIHEQVRGTLPDGRLYRADDPALLTWVHVTESFGFLEGFRRYSPMTLPIGAADAYYGEVRRVAEALGARDVPGTEAEVAAFFARMQGELRLDERSRAFVSPCRWPDCRATCSSAPARRCCRIGRSTCSRRRASNAPEPRSHRARCALFRRSSARH